MICQLCRQKEATLQMTGLVDGHKQTLNLCRQCAQGLAGQVGTVSSLWDNFFDSFLPGPTLFGYPGQIKKTSPAPKACPACGETEGQLLETGLLGCSHCYETFAQQLTPVFGRVHGHTSHLDRPLAEAQGKPGDKLTALRQQLATAVDQEAYEQAARIRDEIRQLEADQASGGGMIMAWYLEEGPESDVVISTRVRLARNLAHTPFPWRLKPQELDYVKDQVTEAFSQICLEEGEKPLIADLEGLDPIELDALAERQIISRKMTRQTRGKALLLFPGEARGILVNEEDHLRIYAVSAGLRLQDTAAQALDCAASLEARLPLAKSDRLGYLTACPSNTGTGMRASVMLHVPGLVRLGVIKALGDKLAKSGYALRGAGGEGTGIEADMIQLSNQVTLGVLEEEILDSLDRLVLDLAQEERKARQTLYARDPLALEDEIARSKGQLMNARLMAELEAKESLSRLRLGRELQLEGLPGYGMIQQLLTSVGQAAIQEEAGRSLTERESQERRAKLIRRTLGDWEEVNPE